MLKQKQQKQNMIQLSWHQTYLKQNTQLDTEVTKGEENLICNLLIMKASPHGDLSSLFALVMIDRTSASSYIGCTNCSSDENFMCHRTRRISTRSKCRLLMILQRSVGINAKHYDLAAMASDSTQPGRFFTVSCDVSWGWCVGPTQT